MFKFKSRKANNFLFPWLLYFLSVIFSLFLLVGFFTIEIPLTIAGKGWFLIGGKIEQITSFHSGVLSKWLVEEGDIVEESQVVAEIISFDEKKIIEVVSHVNGKLSEILIFEGSKVALGESLAIVTKEGDNEKDLEVMAFVSSLEGKKVLPGMNAFISPSITSPYKEGYLLAQVVKVGRLPIAKSSLYSLIKIPEIAKYMRENVESEPFLVFLKPKPNPQHKTGYVWSKSGPSFSLESGIIADVSIVIDEPKMGKIIWPSLYNFFGGE